MGGRYITQDEAYRRIGEREKVVNALPSSSPVSALLRELPLALSMPECCAVLRMDRQTVVRMIKEGRLAAYRAGTRWRILIESVKAYREGRVLP